MENFKNNKYLAVSSRDSLQYFPGNKPTHFTTLLNTPLHRQAGDWFIGLRHIWIEVQQPLVSAGGVYICFDVYITQASGTLVDGCESMLVRRISTFLRKGTKVVSITFDSCDMIPIRLPHLDKIEVVIKPVQPTELSFDPETTTYATLLLSQQQ